MSQNADVYVEREGGCMTTTIMMMKVWHVIQLLTIDHAGVHPGCDGVDVNARLGHLPVNIRQRVRANELHAFLEDMVTRRDGDFEAITDGKKGAMQKRAIKQRKTEK